VTCDRSVDFSRYSIQHYVIKFVSDLQQVGGFLQVLDPFSSNTTDRHDKTETLNTTILTPKFDRVALASRSTLWALSNI